MSSLTGPNYSPDNQISFVVQWFRTWSELQKDDFVEVLAPKLGNCGSNGLVNGMQKLDMDGSKRVSLFSCQIKLFNEWWATWSDAEKESLTNRLKESDPKFWTAVQEELNGTRKKVEDDFFFSINNCNGNSTTETKPTTNGQADAEVEVEVDDQKQGEAETATVTINGQSDNDDQLEMQNDINVSGVTVTVNGSEEEKAEDTEPDQHSG